MSKYLVIYKLKTRFQVHIVSKHAILPTTILIDLRSSPLTESVNILFLSTQPRMITDVSLKSKISR